MCFLTDFRRVGIQKNPTLTWGGQYKTIHEIQLPLQNADGTILTEGIYEISLVDPIVDNSQYVVRAHVVDSYGCHGKDGNFTHRVGMLNASSKICNTCSFAATLTTENIYTHTIFVLF